MSLQVIPEKAAYRQDVEQFTKFRMQVVTENEDVRGGALCFSRRVRVEAVFVVCVVLGAVCVCAPRRPVPTAMLQAPHACHLLRNQARRRADVLVGPHPARADWDD
jgi:hypothetical protein